MTIYSRTEIKGHKKDNAGTHSWANGKGGFHSCYHYSVPDEVGEQLIAAGKAKQMHTLFGCMGDKKDAD